MLDETQDEDISMEDVLGAGYYTPQAAGARMAAYTAAQKAATKANDENFERVIPNWEFLSVWIDGFIQNLDEDGGPDDQDFCDLLGAMVRLQKALTVVGFPPPDHVAEWTVTEKNAKLAAAQKEAKNKS